MKIILTKGWNLLSPGAELDVHPPIAELLIGRGVARASTTTQQPKIRIVGRRERTKGPTR